MAAWTHQIEFRDPARSEELLARVTAAAPAELHSPLVSVLASAPDPDAAVSGLERLVTERPEAFARLARLPAALPVLAAIFSVSRFLSDAIANHPEWVEELIASGDFERALGPEDYRAQLERELGPGVPSPEALARFRRRRLLRIVARDAMGVATLAETTLELSSLADAILELCCTRIQLELCRRHGSPRPSAGQPGPDPASFAVIALGKLGGLELNYSSDIDLMFVYSANGQTDGPERVSNKEFFHKLACQLTALLSAFTSEGQCYRVDLRLRPDGRLGEIALSLEAALDYYRRRARDWELQMLIKARPAAGDRQLGARLLEAVEPLIYSSTLDFSVVEAAVAARERISEKLSQRRVPGGLDIKLARGGIRDIEFLVQCLQRLHGGREPWVRHAGTLLALFRLRDKNLLSPREYSRLASAYQFLRHLEHRLQLVEDRQTHTLPLSDQELTALARRMPLSQIGRRPTAELLRSELERHLEEVREIYERVIHAQQPVYYQPPPGPPPEAAPPPAPAAVNLIRSLDERAPQLAMSLARGCLRRGTIYFEHLLERLVAEPERLRRLDEQPVLAGYLFDLLDHSPYFAEELIRAPELLDQLARLHEGHAATADRFAALREAGDPVELRRLFRREMFRIQAESICLWTPIFTTLEETSDLADAVLTAAYRMAVRQVAASHPPATPGYEPTDQMMVIALGRLGMREFDLASDADLVFVLPEREAAELVFWTRVAERMIALISAYTGQGVIFAVDTRLRPDGREGPLVQTDTAYKGYFAERAEAWEGITYMKARAVAGDLERGTEFLKELQRVDWRRYGQSGRSRARLAQMRRRIEKEQGAANPLKAGRGGYYDIDFALMYLRLKGAGIFYRVLNTPARIDVIEEMGHLDRQDADFLRDAATFYRAVDHGLRVISGQAAGALPRSGPQAEMLAELVSRWTPDHLHDEPLEIELAHIQERTREFFDRLFGA
ncbi:MAG: glutamine-synthetase adenylyltransferase [Bryobacterales bacterium]|nr:glutamine-synthetase adenylyltransferase [Bryobacteraceae bacterium]MDW8130598.1 glutamine-synthetase adenylyltransferase [Bryobacterales bacterium]